jgi:hypothetical protein
MNEAMKDAWLEISQMLGEPTREELDVFLRTWQRAKQAYSVPVQEPVAWMYEDMMGLVGVRVQKEKPIVARPVTPLCLCNPPAAQRQWVGLEREIAAAVLDHCYGHGGVSDDMIERTTEVIEAKLKEKNT